MFNLESQIKAWRSQLLQNESVTETEVDELESHLRDSVDELHQRSLASRTELGRTDTNGALTVEEAFHVAVRRIGSPETLALEFSKINGVRTWTRRLQWMLAGYLVLSLLLRVAGTFSNSLTIFAVYLHVPLWVAVAISGAGATICTVLLVLGAWHLTNGRSFGLQRLATKFALMTRSGRQIVVITGVVLAIVCMNGLEFGARVISLDKVKNEAADGWRRDAAADAAHYVQPEQCGIAALVSSSTGWLANLLLFGTIALVLCWLLENDGQRLARWGASRVYFATLTLALALLCGFGSISFALKHIYGSQFLAAY